MGPVAANPSTGLESLIDSAPGPAPSRDILDALPIAMYLTDADGWLTHVNPAAIALAGRTPRLGADRWCPTWKLYRPDESILPHEQSPMAVALREGRSLRGEQVIAERPDGTRLWLEARSTPLVDGQGRLTGGIGVLLELPGQMPARTPERSSHKDLFDEFKAIELLQQVSMHLARAEDCQSLYDHIMDAAVAIMRSDCASMQMYYPERGRAGELHLLAFRGFDPEAVRFWEWVRADSGCTCGQALRTGQRAIAADVETCEFMAGTPDRSAYLAAGMCAAQSTPLFSRAGKLVGMISTHWKRPHQPSERDLRLLDVLARQAADWMERLLAEETLRRTADALRGLVEESPMGIYTVDSDFRITHISRGAMPAFRNVTPIIGRDFAEVMHAIWPDSFANEAIRIFRRVLDTGEPYVSPGLTEKRKDIGATESYEWQANRVMLADGKFGVVCYYFDSTRLQETYRALERAREQAEHANRAKDRFLAVLSHELRTPLSPVVMSVAAMETAPELPAALREELAMIRRNIDLEVRLIDDLLDLSRIATGKMRLDMQPTHVHPALRQAVQNCASEITAKKLCVRLDLQARNDLVSADPARIQQVYWNLIRNAAKFTPAGGEIVIRTLSDSQMVRIEVRDNGVGIPPEHLPRVFDAFEQGDLRTSRQFGGLGLGLAICKAVVDMHGGTIAAASDGAGKGASFTVEFPAISADAPSPHVAQRSGKEPALGNPRILLVEDHGDTADVVSRLLRGSGYLVTVAGSIAAALKLAASQSFDVVISDLGLPDGTGYELMRQIRERHGIKGIALSGYGMEEDQRKSRDAGFIDHIVKPVNVAHLEAVIRRVISGHAGS